MKINEELANLQQKHINSWLYYGCLFVYLLLSLGSHVLASSSLVSSDLGFYLIAQFSSMFLLMLIICRLSANSNELKDFRILILFAILVRLVLIGVEPYSSNDVARYLFDGKIALSGFDPYRISHDAFALTELREQWQPPVEHAKYVTLYPPLALALFSLAASVGVEYATLAWQVMLTLASLVILAFAIIVLKNANKLRFLPLIALSPLLTLESGMALHIDTFSTLAILVVLYAWQRQKLVLAGVAIGLGTLIKVLPLVLLLPLSLACISAAYQQNKDQQPQTLRRSSLPFIYPLLFSLRDAWQLCFTAISVVVIGYLSAFLLGFYPIGSISIFFDKWRFAAPLFSFFEEDLSLNQLLIISSAIASLVITIICYLSITSQQGTSHRHTALTKVASSEEQVLLTRLPTGLIIALQLALALPLLLSPVLFPWYLMPLVPLIALQPNFYALAWLFIMPMTYEVITQFHCCQLWAPAQWPLYLLAGLYLMAFLHGITLLITNKNNSTLKQAHSTEVHDV